MTFRPDTSFPYLAIARRFGVPYGKVLAVADRLASLGTADSRLWIWVAGEHGEESDLYNAVHHAWHAESARRAAIERR